ncbi:MAG: hypothetical protein IT286_04875 [Proteobacteria bacterium]|jgi:adenylate kinase family enzyme|nr:hypothetical protein [Pseudomonadota bacterium]
MKKLLIILALIQPAWAQDGIEKTIIEKIKKTDPVCTSCRMIVQEKTSPWIKNHKLYEVTTFDILPPPAWNIAVKDKEIIPLDRRKIDDWNAVMMNEKIMLDKDERVVQYVKFFLSTTMNQSEYIDKLLESEVKRIEAKEKKKIDRETKINRSADKIQVVFYANDTQGDLQQWNVVLKETGEIVKLQQRSF